MKNADSLESILADMRQKHLQGSAEKSQDLAPTFVADTAENLRPSASQHPSLDRLLKELERELPRNPPAQSVSSATPAQTRALDPELDRLVLQQQADAQAQIVQKAQEWLNALDPLSGEAVWFGELAKHYPSPLDAAIDLLAR